jgi:hypothetical protein
MSDLNQREYIPLKDAAASSSGVIPAPGGLAAGWQRCES